MALEFARSFLLWCALINYALLLIWFLLFTRAHNWMYRFHSRWFHLSVEQYDAAHFSAIALFKLGVLLFNLVPLIALYIVG